MFTKHRDTKHRKSMVEARGIGEPGLQVELAAGSGYSLLEVMMAVVVSTIGLVSLLALFSQSVVTMFLVQEDLLARQKVREILESVSTARNTQSVSWSDIENVADSGIFQDDFLPMKIAGNDGLVGTADDGAVETIQLPGPDGQLGTGDDINRMLTNFQRKIEVDEVLMQDSNPYPNLKKITVTVKYTTSQGFQRSVVMSSFVSQHR